ncbi:hypothetical protein D9758_008237 [Tetrapyrgos nigripes]|uniref:Paired amphipathic helix protein Sin3a n=1 Tax=Tetrapyrgos nigripes TaxID=182062 RepID=A0A8H5LFE5_9AGAR|nr:hypothetical protein D9758_008237 [Tetrapyrgos nigripes]
MPITHLLTGTLPLLLTSLSIPRVSSSQSSSLIMSTRHTSQSRQYKSLPGYDASKNPNHQTTVSNALSYLDAVKSALHDKPEEYDRFLGIMSDFQNQQVDVLGSMKRIADLFHSHPNLITGYNVFLPPGYRIELSSESRSPRMITPGSTSGATRSA